MTRLRISEPHRLRIAKVLIFAPIVAVLAWGAWHAGGWVAVAGVASFAAGLALFVEDDP